MFFAKHRSAVHLVDEMGLNAGSKEALALIDWIVPAAKFFEKNIKEVTKLRLSDDEIVLMTVATMPRHQSAFDALSNAGFDASTLIERAVAAGRRRAIAKGYESVVKHSYDRASEVAREATGTTKT